MATFALAIVGAICAYGAMLGARGNGWSPVVFIVLGLFGVPLVASLLKRFAPRGGWVARLHAMLFVGFVSFAVAKYSARIGTADAYGQIFNAPPPPGMTLLAARKQWYDGTDYVIAFQSNRASIDAVLNTMKSEERDPSSATSIVGTQAPFMDMRVITPPGYAPTHLWNSVDRRPRVTISWESSTGRGLIKGSWD